MSERSTSELRPTLMLKCLDLYYGCWEVVFFLYFSLFAFVVVVVIVVVVSEHIKVESEFCNTCNVHASFYKYLSGNFDDQNYELHLY